MISNYRTRVWPTVGREGTVDPKTGRPYVPGAMVQRDSYIRRRLRAGDLVEKDPAKPAVKKPEG